MFSNREPLREPINWLWLPRTLSSRLVLGNVIVLVLVLLVMGFISHELVTRRLQSEMDGRLRQRAAEFETVTRMWQASGQLLDTAFFNRLIQSDPSGELAADPFYLKVIDKTSGQTLTTTPGLARDRLPMAQADFEIALAGQPTFSTTQDITGGQVRTLTFPLRDENNNLLAVAQVFQSLQAVERVGVVLTTVLVLTGLFAVILAYGVGYWLTRRQLQPLNQLASTMHSLSEQGLHLRLNCPPTSAEVELLAQAFNQMVGRLEAGFAGQRAFVADASHELRTPLTALRGQIEVMLYNPAVQGELRQEVQQVNTELSRLSRLVVNLLTHARTEAGMSPRLQSHNLRPVELDGLLIEVVHQMRFVRPQVELSIEQLEQITLAGDADMLKQLFFNLLDNALTHTPGGGKVSLDLSQVYALDGLESGQPVTGWAMVNISDTGSGIAPTDLPYIFQRHYRASQTSAVRQTGAGLGLYIARLIAQAHGGEIGVKSELGQGTCFSVRLPLNLNLENPV